MSYSFRFLGLPMVISVLVGEAPAQPATIIHDDDFESYAVGESNLQLQRPDGTWWMVQNSRTQSGCNNNITPDQHKVVATGVYAGSRACRMYYNTMEQWYEQSTSKCKWRVELGERMNGGRLPSSGPTEVWYGFAVKPMHTNNAPWVKRCMGTTGSDVNCTGLRDGLITHVCQFIADETGSKNVLLDIHANMDGSNWWHVSYIGAIPASPTPVLWNEWNTVIINAKTGAGGWVHAWINGTKYSFAGDLHEASWVYDFKFGIYGDRVNEYAEAYFDNIRIARGHDGGYDLVNPAGITPAPGVYRVSPSRGLTQQPRRRVLFEGTETRSGAERMVSIQGKSVKAAGSFSGAPYGVYCIIPENGR